MENIYRPDRPFVLASPPGAFTCAFRTATAGVLGADAARFTAAMCAELAPFNYFLFATARFGSMRYRTGQEEITMRPGVAVHYPNETVLASHWDDDVTVRIVRVPLPVIGRIAEERFGLPADRLRFTGCAPFRRPWRRPG